MACTFFRLLVLVSISITYKLRYILCDENILIDLREDQPQVHSDFTYDQLITDNQLKLFQLYGVKAVDTYYKAYPHHGRPICAVLKGLCANGKNLYDILDKDNNRDPETRVYVRVDEDFKTTNHSKEAKHIQFLSHTFTNNGTKKIRWSPPDEFTYSTRIRRTHSLEKNKSAWSLEAGVTFLNIITASGSSFKIELSEWSLNSNRASSFQVKTGNIFEIDVDPGETIKFYTTYKERTLALDLTYRMSIDNDWTYKAEFNKSSSGNVTLWTSRPYSTLALLGMPNTFNHTVKLELTYATDIVQVIKNEYAPIRM